MKKPLRHKIFIIYIKISMLITRSLMYDGLPTIDRLELCVGDGSLATAAEGLLLLISLSKPAEGDTSDEELEESCLDYNKTKINVNESP